MTSTTPQQQDFYFVVDKIDVVPELRVRPRINVSEDLFRGGTANMGGGGVKERAQQYEKNIRDINAKHVGQLLGIHYTKITKDSVVRRMCSRIRCYSPFLFPHTLSFSYGARKPQCP
jgi:hypothetical protein